MGVIVSYDFCCWKDDGCKTKCSCTSVPENAECQNCAVICPEGAISRSDRVEIDDELCTDCSICIESYPNGALSR
ncbi:hypothetical protein KAH81_07780 [bacterium]|nr:hypothetical protein [bacterium]